ncbi:hypothetical protein BVX97_04095 [bacterium E08(2017)]|nr:hypothetical protein BVX97_04095 [bacterium E08(2017)]
MINQLLGSTRLALYSLLYASLLVFCGCGGESGGLLLDRGLSLLEAGKYKESITVLERAGEKLPENASVQLNLGIAYWKTGQSDKAIPAIKMAADLAENDGEPLEFLGHIYSELEQWDQAQIAFEGAMEREGRSPELLTSAAVVKLRAEDLIKARLLLYEAINADPLYTPALYNIGLMYRDKAKNPRQAEQYLRRFLEAAKDPEREGADVPKAYIDEAQEYIQQIEEDRMREEAIRAQEAAAIKMAEVGKKQDEAKTVAVNSLLDDAMAAIGREEFVAAKKLIEKAHAAEPENPDPTWMLAVLYDQHLDYPEMAEKKYREFKKKHPEDNRSKRIMLPGEKKQTPEPVEVEELDTAKQYFEQALKYHEAAKWDEAIAYYKKTLELNAKMHNALYNMGLVYKKKGELDNSLALFKKTTVVQPELIKGWYMLAVVHKDRKEYGEAEAAAKKALDLNPSYDKAHFIIGLVYAMTDQTKLARRHYTKCIQSTKDAALAARARRHMNSLR